jgi:hydroxymethylpyrimidine pyrophosphatase-like HAD family hydrolase
MTIEDATKQAFDRGLEAGWQGTLMTVRPLFAALHTLSALLMGLT